MATSGVKRQNPYPGARPYPAYSYLFNCSLEVPLYSASSADVISQAIAEQDK